MSELLPTNKDSTGHFSLKLFRVNTPSSTLKTFNRLLIPELFALTLLKNREALRLLTHLSPFIRGGFGVPPVGGDSWINSWIDHNLKRPRFKVSAASRSDLRKKILSYATKPELATKERFGPDFPAEHVSVRAYPIRLHSPQVRKDAITKRVLLVAYDLQRHWLYFQIEPLRYPYENRNFSEIDVAASLLKKSQWSDFLAQLTRTYKYNWSELPICLHVPERSELLLAFEQVVGQQPVQVIDDMPPEYDGSDRFHLEIFRRKTAGLRDLYVDASAEIKKVRKSRAATDEILLDGVHNRPDDLPLSVV